jgi:hypothetical protein
MKKASAKKTRSAARRAAKPAPKAAVKRVAKKAAKMTQHAAASALTEIEHSLGVLKKSKVGQGAAAAGHDTVKAALVVASKLNRVVKGMKSAKLI